MRSTVLGRMRERKLQFAVLVIVGSIIALGTADFLTGVHQLSAYDGGWNDLSGFREALERSHFRTSCLLSTPMLLNSSEGSPAIGRALVIIGVEKPYLESEITTIVDFVLRGGYLLLADDFGYGNALATKLGFGFSGRTLYSSDFDRNPAFVRINASLGGQQYSVLLDEPTALDRVSSREVLAYTHPDSWLDENGNGERDIDEESNPYPVMAKLGRGQGYVVVVSDPGLFINDLWDRADNERFVAELINRSFPGATEFIFEESRHKPETFREGAWRTGLFLEVLSLNNYYGKGVLAFLALLALAVAAMRVRTPAEWTHEDTLSEISLYLLAERRYRPEDRERLRRILREKLRLSLGLYPDEFDALDAGTVRSFLGDERLAHLVEDPKGVDLLEMDELVARVRAWNRG